VIYEFEFIGNNDVWRMVTGAGRAREGYLLLKIVNSELITNIFINR